MNLLAQFCYYLTSTSQNWSLDSIPLCLLLDDSFLQSLFLPPHTTKQYEHTSELRVTCCQAAAIAARSKYRKAKVWLMKKSSRSSSGINKNQLMEGSKIYLQDIERFVLSGFFSCILRKRTEKKTETEPYMS